MNFKIPNEMDFFLRKSLKTKFKVKKCSYGTNVMSTWYEI